MPLKKNTAAGLCCLTPKGILAATFRAHSKARRRQDFAAGFPLFFSRIGQDAVDVEVKDLRQLLFDLSDFPGHFVSGCGFIEWRHDGRSQSNPSFGTRWIKDELRPAYRGRNRRVIGIIDLVRRSPAQPSANLRRECRDKCPVHVARRRFPGALALV